MPPAPAKTLLLTRTPAGNAAVVVALDKALDTAGIGAVQVVTSPLLEISALSETIDTRGIQTLIYTSAHGVAADVDRNLPCHVVGPRTAQVAAEAGHPVLNVHENSAGMLSAFAASPPQGPVLHLSGNHTRGQIVENLVSRGISARRQVVYTQAPRPLSAEAQALGRGEAEVIIPLFSPRTAAQFCRVWTGKAVIHGIALSKSVADPVAGMAWTSFRVASAPDLGAMVTGIVDTLIGVPG